MDTRLDPGLLVRRARERAGLTQRELARRADTAQSVVSRIETGRASPRTETLDRLLAAAGFEVRTELIPRPAPATHMLEDVPRILALSPEERLLEVRNLSRLDRSARRVTTPPCGGPAAGRA